MTRICLLCVLDIFLTTSKKNLIVLYILRVWKTESHFICMRKRSFFVWEPCEQFTWFAENISWWDGQVDMQQFLLPGLFMFMFSWTITIYILYSIVLAFWPNYLEAPGLWNIRLVCDFQIFFKCNLFGQNTFNKWHILLYGEKVYSFLSFLEPWFVIITATYWLGQVN